MCADIDWRQMVSWCKKCHKISDEYILSLSCKYSQTTSIALLCFWFRTRATSRLWRTSKRSPRWISKQSTTGCCVTPWSSKHRLKTRRFDWQSASACYCLPSLRCSCRSMTVTGRISYFRRFYWSQILLVVSLIFTRWRRSGPAQVLENVKHAGLVVGSDMHRLVGIGSVLLLSRLFLFLLLLSSTWSTCVCILAHFEWNPMS